MAISNDSKMENGRTEPGVFPETTDLKARIGELKDGVKDDVKDRVSEVIGISGTAAHEAGRRLKDEFRDGIDTVKDGAGSLREGIRNCCRKAGWKTAVGVIGGIVVVAGIIIAARRRRSRGTLIERGMREGTRFAMLVPEGFHAAQKSAQHMADDVSRSAVRRWNKLPWGRVS
jgi:hypothetical protein